MSNPIFSSPSQNQNINSPITLLNQIKNAANPQQAAEQILFNNPNFKGVVNYINQNGGDAKTAFYNLEAILAVGFRVRSIRGTQFRQWANSTLKEFLEKGFILDDERLKNPDGRPDFFDELLDRIRDIRASEKRFYQKLQLINYLLHLLKNKLVYLQ